MLITEWDTEEAKEVWFEEGFDEGLEKGIEKGIEQGIERGREEGREQGIERGREEGWFALAELLREGKTLDEAMEWLKDHRSAAPSHGM